MNVLELATDALRDLGVISEIDTPSAEQGQIFVRKLNELMATLAEDGIDLGYAPVSTTTDTVVLPLGHVSTIKALCAIRCAPMYAGSVVPPLIAALAESGYNRLLGQAVSMQIERAQSSTLPFGENQRYGFDITEGY